MGSWRQVDLNVATMMWILFGDRYVSIDQHCILLCVRKRERERGDHSCILLKRSVWGTQKHEQFHAPYSTTSPPRYKHNHLNTTTGHWTCSFHVTLPNWWCRQSHPPVQTVDQWFWSWRNHKEDIPMPLCNLSRPCADPRNLIEELPGTAPCAGHRILRVSMGVSHYIIHYLHEASFAVLTRRLFGWWAHAPCSSRCYSSVASSTVCWAKELKCNFTSLMRQSAW